MSSLEIILKPIGGLCNMKCDYCYYWFKRDQVAPFSKMSDSLLKKTIKQILVFAQKTGNTRVILNWHGGEPLLAGIDFYKRAIEIEKEYRQSEIEIANIIQTNGSLIDNNWADFFLQEKFTVGVSIDGPEFIHNSHRVFKNGRGSYKRAMDGIRILKDKGLRPQALLVLHNQMADYPEETYEFFKNLQIHEIDILPCLENNLSSTELSGEKFGNFLIKVFDLWVKDNNPNFQIRFFRSILMTALGATPTLCTMCGFSCIFPSITENGNVYFCDSFEDLPEYRLGNLNDSDLWKIVSSEKTREKRNFLYGLKDPCKKCEFFSLCGGGCSRAFLEKSLNESQSHHPHSLCIGYKMIYGHVIDYLRETSKKAREIKIHNVQIG